MSTIPQNEELLKHLFELLSAYQGLYKQTRTYNRVLALAVAELFVFTRHVITQQLMALGLNEEDWSIWYRLFTQQRFDYDASSALLFEQTLEHVRDDELYVVVGDGTQTARSSRKMEGSGWLRNLRTPPFMVGIHAAQRWFNGAWLMPVEKGYSRALPLRWMPAFTEKSEPKEHVPKKEWEAAIDFLRWLIEQCLKHERHQQKILMLSDGSYDTLNMWKHLPSGVILMARSAKNRVLYYLPPEDAHKNRKYGQRAAAPQDIWQDKQTKWRKLKIDVRGKTRHLQYHLVGPVLRKGVSEQPLFLIVVRGKVRQRKGRKYRRYPLPFLVNAIQDEQGHWGLPLPVKTLLEWMWQRWEVEVCHRELKSNFGLGDKQCWNPHSAVLSVQWSAWVYSIMLLAGYRTWGLSNAPPVPTRWWRGAQRWSLNTLWRAFRAAFWGEHHFRPLWDSKHSNWPEKEAILQALPNAIYAAARS